MDLGIGGKVAMVAASSKGLGRACALELAREGCQVSLCGRSADNLRTAEAAIRSVVPEARLCLTVCDVSKASDLEAWHRATVEHLGPVGILVTNTGGPAAATFLDLSEAQWTEGVDSTLLNVVRLCRLVLPDMRSRRWGRILHITSLVAKQPAPLLTVSSTLRAGLSGLTKTLAAEFAKEGITVNAVLPGHILTDRQLHLAMARCAKDGITEEDHFARLKATIPANRLGDPSELAAAVAFLASERAAYITGTSLQVDGGIVLGTF